MKKLIFLMVIFLTMGMTAFSQDNQEPPVANTVRTFVTDPGDYPDNPQILQNFIAKLRDYVQNENDLNSPVWNNLNAVSRLEINVISGDDGQELQVQSMNIVDAGGRSIEIEVSGFLESINAVGESDLAIFKNALTESGLVFRRSSTVAIPVSMIEDVATSDFAGIWSIEDEGNRFNKLLDLLCQISTDVASKRDQITLIKVLYANTRNGAGVAVQALQVGYKERNNFKLLHSLPAEQFIYDLSNIDISSDRYPSLAKYLFQQFFKGSDDSVPDNLPQDWRFKVTLNKISRNKFSKSITVYNLPMNINGADSIVIDDKSPMMSQLERTTRLNFNEIGREFIQKAVSGVVHKEAANNIQVYLTFEYDDELNSNKYKAIQYNIRADNELKGTHQTQNQLVNYSLASLFGFTPLSTALVPEQPWIKPTDPEGDQVKPRQEVELVDATTPPVTEEFFPVTFGFDEFSIHFKLYSQKLKLGTKFSHDEFNYPWVWSGSMAFYAEWNLNRVPPITWLVDDIRFSWRPYNYANRTLINYLTYSVDNRFFNRNDAPERISINNMQFILNKTISYESIEDNISWMPTSETIKEIGYNVSFQLPLSFPKNENSLGKEIQHYAADFSESTYNYFSRFSGFGFTVGIKEDAPLNRFPLKLDYVSYSVYRIWEKPNNLIQHNDFIVSEDPIDKYTQHYFTFGTSYTTRDNTKSFMMDIRAGVGDRWSTMFDIKQHIWGQSVWLQLKYAIYQTNSFRFNRVLMAGPVFYLRN